MPRLGRVVAALLLGLVGFAVAGTWASAPASAHDQLIGSSPAADAVLDAAPSDVTLTFNADVLPISPTIIVRDAAGAVVVDAEPTVSGAVVSTPLPADLPPGTYAVVWRVVSTDGHPIEGTFAFTIAGAAPPPPAPGEPTTAPTTSEPAATAASPTPETDDDADAAGMSSFVPLALAVGAAGAVGAAALLTVRRRRDS